MAVGVLGRKRVATPKSGPGGCAYDLAHRAWRAGVIDGWHVMEDGSWSLKVDGWRLDGLSVGVFAGAVEVELECAGVTVEWASSTWLGRREVVVTAVDDGEEVVAA